jgi:DNA-directed RNA polymerase beta' subunit
MKQISSTLIALLIGVSAFTQELTKESIKEIQSSLTMDAYTKAMQNALSNNEVNQLQESWKTLMRMIIILPIKWT